MSARTADRDLEKTAVGARTCFPGRVVVVQKAEIETRVLRDIEIGSFDTCPRLLYSLSAPGFDHSGFFLDVKFKEGEHDSTGISPGRGGVRIFCRATEKKIIRRVCEA